MRTHRIGLLVVLGLMATSIAAAESRRRYEETVWLNPDGSARVEVTVVVPANAEGPVRIPVQGGTPTAVIASVRTQVQDAARVVSSARLLTARWRADRQEVEVVSDPPTEHETVVFVAFTSPPVDSTDPRREAVVNTTDDAMQPCLLTVVMPEGYATGRLVGSTVPSGTPTPSLGARNGRHAVTLEANLPPRGGTLSLVLTVEPQPQRTVVPMLLALLGTVYLYGCRDLISRRHA